MSLHSIKPPRKGSPRINYDFGRYKSFKVYVGSDILFNSFSMAVNVTLPCVFATPCKYCEDYHGDPD